MKTRAVKNPALCGGLLLAAAWLAAACSAQSSAGRQAQSGAAPPQYSEARFGPWPSGESQPALNAGKAPQQDGDSTGSRVGLSLLKNIALDQKAIWTGSARWRREDATWILPFAAIASASLGLDTHASKAVTSSPSLLHKSNAFSDYGVAAFGGMIAGTYLLGKMTENEHERETGILSGEAAIDAVGATTALQYAFGRQRPGQGGGGGGFWRGGNSFPSDHAAAAWAVASVFAHEYPGPLTKIVAYGLASAVSVSRVTGKDHFPTDVLAGAAIGWFVGQHVYRAHHDQELSGDDWQTLREARAASDGQTLHNTGSPYIPLDSWIYPEIDRLIALDYIHSASQDVRPFTRLECATLVEEAGDSLADGEPIRGEGDRLYHSLAAEFQDEFAVLAGEGKEQSIRLESAYTKVNEISGPALNDSDHFGQTLIDNFGRPYQRGFNTQDGFSGYGITGRYTVYVRGEFQHAPSAPALPFAARELAATADNNPVQAGTPIASVNKFTLLDTYVAANVGGFTVSAGKQSLWWGRGVGGALIYSDNAEPIYMLRVRPTESYLLPWIFRWFGPMKADLFFGELAGNAHPQRPLIHGLKITAQKTRYIEASLMATSEFGGLGRPLTMGSLYHSFFSTKSSDLYAPAQSPGKRTIGADFSYAIPHLRNWLRIYANGLLPEDNPTHLDTSTSQLYIWERMAIRSGVFLPRVPHIPRMDLRIESSYTDPPTDRSRYGQYVYYNNFYHNLYTDHGNLIGDWVGRQGMGFQGWSTYWFRPRNSIQLSYRHAKVDPSFIPGGETISDGSVQVDWQVKSDWNVSTGVQYEKWFAPILAPGPQSNWTSSVQIEFRPRSWGW
jgi:hypothetical protein